MRRHFDPEAADSTGSEGDTKAMRRQQTIFTSQGALLRPSAFDVRRSEIDHIMAQGDGLLDYLYEEEEEEEEAGDVIFVHSIIPAYQSHMVRV